MSIYQLLYADIAHKPKDRDPRKPSVPLRTHSSTHSDDITSLSFSSSMTDKVVLSGSSDGLISLSNPDEDDEDEAVLHVANWGCSVSQAGWIIGEGGAKIWAASDMETLSTWTNEVSLSADGSKRFSRPHLARPTHKR